MPRISKYGTWNSPITADLIAGQTISLIATAVDVDDLYWVESRPREGGRYVIMRRAADGRITECTPPDFNVRSTVHEYGGGAFTVSDGVIYFVNYQDQHIYAHSRGDLPRVLTPSLGYRYADLIHDKMSRRLICVREDHTGTGEAVNTIVSVDPARPQDVRVLAGGNDFYSSPRPRPDGKQLAYLTWNHPNMPWDGCELWVADVAPDGTLHAPRRVAGATDESVFQPEWSPDGVLYFVAESTGWWNLYRWQDDRIEALAPMDAEFGKPQWVFGMSTYAFISAGKILCRFLQDGRSHLAWLDTVDKKLLTIQTAYTDVSEVRCGHDFGLIIAGSPVEPSSVVRINAVTDEVQVLKRSFDVATDQAYLSIPEAVRFPTSNGNTANAFFYPPRNADFSAPPAEHPPLLVISHGGPTSATGTTLRYAVQYWTSRGFAVLDVNYRGSAGYGREYRRSLNGQWGVRDVDDCCNGALHMAALGRADRNRLAIRGGSAGGYTTLACLTFRSGVFGAGASHYGVADLERLAQDTHKFESHYLNSLVGPYPERKDLYCKRSPINFTNSITCPLILFQGDEDMIVPPSQSLMMFEALRARGVPVAYLLFHGEQHGFRRAENIKRSLEAELYFYSRIFKFAAADEIEPVAIENLEPSEP